MLISARHALVTGGSRGIGRGISLKLAEQGVHVAINYVRDEASAKKTLEQVRARGADGFIVQADVSKPAQIERLFNRVRDEFGSLDIFVANARTEVGSFYEPTMSISLEKWDTARTRRQAFLVGVREAESMVATPHQRDYLRTGRTLREWQSGRHEREISDGNALALRGGARRADHRQRISQAGLKTACSTPAGPVWQMIRDHHQSAGRPCAGSARRRYRQRGGAALFAGSGWMTRPLSPWMAARR